MALRQAGRCLKQPVKNLVIIKLKSMQISGNLFATGFALAGHPEMTLQGQIPSCYQPIFPQPQNTDKIALKNTFCKSLTFYY